MAGYLGFKIEQDELSERMGGGLPRGAIMVIEAPYGAGKSIVSQRMMYGLLANGHTVGTVSTELTTLGFIDQMKSLNYPIEQSMLKRDLVYLPVYPLLGARQTPHDLLSRLRNAKAIYDKEVVVVDTISKLFQDQLRIFQERGVPPSKSTSQGGLTQIHELTPEQALMNEAEETLYTMKRLAASGKTFIITIEPDQTPKDVLTLFRDASDIHIGLDFSLQGNAAQRRIVVNRFSRAKGRFGDVVGYRVEPGVGLVIEIKSVS